MITGRIELYAATSLPSSHEEPIGYLVCIHMSMSLPLESFKICSWSSQPPSESARLNSTAASERDGSPSTSLLVVCETPRTATTKRFHLRPRQENICGLKNGLLAEVLRKPKRDFTHSV